MIEQLSHAEKEQCKALYKVGFPADTDVAVDYFVDKYATKIVVNADFSVNLYLIDKKLNYCGLNVNIAYIVAFSADVKVRGTGAACEVFNAAIRHLHDLNIPFAALSPFNHTYYKRYGFATVDSYRIYPNVSALHCVESENLAEFAPIAQEIYSRAVRQYDISIARSHDDFYKLMNCQIIGMDKPCLYYAEGEVIGYAICKGDYVEEQIMLLPSEDGALNAQARIVSAIEAVKLTQFANITCDYCFTLLDTILGDSTYRLQITNGVGVLTATKELQAEFSVDIADFTKQIMIGERVGNPIDNALVQRSIYLADKY